MQPDSGTVSTGSLQIGYLKQETQEANTAQSVLEKAMSAFAAVKELEAEEDVLLKELEVHPDHEDPDHERLLIRLDEIHGRLAALEAHRAQPKAEAILTGLGFHPDDQGRPISSFSGGWRMRVALAHLLLSSPDILLLDEPTNHLDIDSIDWLETYLKSFAGSVVIVSHDRYFLDRMVNGIVELSQGNLTEYAGNYTFYLQDRVERRLIQKASFENQQKVIQETERFIERFRAKASKARQVQSRVKALDSLVRLPAPPADESTIVFRFPDPPRASRVLMELPSLSKTYETDEGEIEVFDNAGPLKIERGDRIALIGPNGAGKSTLARILLGTEPFGGELIHGQKMELSYFAQNQAESLPKDRSVFQVVQETAVDRTETWIRTLLGAFLFNGDDVFKPIKVLSGGERSRVALAKTLISPANFLILDEPTNHLDIQSRNVLIEALRQYEGTFVLVSHDRHFLDQTATSIWRVDNKSVQIYQGNYSDYQWQVTHGTASSLAANNGASSTNAGGKASVKKRAAGEQNKSAKAARADEAPQRQSGPKTKEQKRLEAEERNKQKKKRSARPATQYSSLNDYKLKLLYEETEAGILTDETEKEKLEGLLADPDVFKDNYKAQKHLSNLDRLHKSLEDLYKVWEALAEEMSARS